MKPYIYGPRNGIYIVNLDLTMKMFRKAYQFMTDSVAEGGSVLFVGTKKQAQSIIKEEAERAGMYFVNHRWLGGMLTNFQAIRNSIERLKKIEAMQEDGSINRFPKKEILQMEKERVKLTRNVGGIKNMPMEGSKQRIVEKATHLQPPVDECAPWRTVVSAMLDDFPYNN